MTLLEAIRERRSVRSFEGNVSSEDAQKILDFAQQQDNPYDIPITWKILDANQYGLSSPVITGTDIYIAGKMKKVPHAEEAFGCTFEKLVLFTQTLGIGTTWIAGTMDRDAFEKAMALSEDEVMPCVSPMGYPARKMSLRESLMRKGVKADSRMDFFELFFAGSFDHPLKQNEAGKLSDILEAVRFAPSAVNRQPWRIVVCPDVVHFYEKSGRNRSTENAWDIQKIDLGIALCHFELAARECGSEVSFLIEDPSLPVPENLQYIASYSLK